MRFTGRRHRARPTTQSLDPAPPGVSTVKEAKADSPHPSLGRPWARRQLWLCHPAASEGRETRTVKIPEAGFQARRSSRLLRTSPRGVSLLPRRGKRGEKASAARLSMNGALRLRRGTPPGRTGVGGGRTWAKDRQWESSSALPAGGAGLRPLRQGNITPSERGKSPFLLGPSSPPQPCQQLFCNAFLNPTLLWLLRFHSIVAVKSELECSLKNILIAYVILHRAPQ